jgi:hypothetical protein
MMARAIGRVLVVAGVLGGASAAAAQEAKPQGAALRRGEIAYLTGLTAGAWSNRYLDYRHAARPGRVAFPDGDRWLGRDKALHATASFSLAMGGIRAGVRPAVAVGGVCAAGLVLESTQVRISPRDALANCSGAGLAWVTSRIFRRR